jgi:KUP system potassium uptake protein
LSHYPSLRKHEVPADYKFIVLNSKIAIDNNLTPYEQLVLKVYHGMKNISLPAEEDFGLEKTNCRVENIPIRIAASTRINVQRIQRTGATDM